MSYTKLGYPAIFATEGFPEEYNPYFHTANDTMDVNDESGWFSIDVSRPSYVARWPCKLAARSVLTVVSCSIWPDSPNWPSRLQLSKPGGITDGDEH